MSTLPAFFAGVLKESLLNFPRQTGEITRGAVELELLWTLKIFRRFATAAERTQPSAILSLQLLVG